MLEPRVLRVRLDAFEARLRPHALDLELRHEHGHLARLALDERHWSLRRQEAEAREVPDVVLVEEDVPGEPLSPDVLEKPLASGAEFRTGDARRLRHRCDLRKRPSPPLPERADESLDRASFGRAGAGRNNGCSPRRAG